MNHDQCGQMVDQFGHYSLAKIKATVYHDQQRLDQDDGYHHDGYSVALKLIGFINNNIILKKKV